MKTGKLLLLLFGILLVLSISSMMRRAELAKEAAGRATPLYIVDGTVFEGDINSLSPNDIESVTVLKDSAAIALYGERGEHGVIIIKTNR